MHPNALLEACTELVRLTLKFDHPADAVVSKFFRDYRKTYAFGPRERATLAETTYNVLRNKLRYDHLAPSGSGPKERRLAILGFADYLQNTDKKFLFGALNKQEAAWLEACSKVQTSELMERHRHNLPEWLVQPLKTQLGDEFWDLVDSLNAPAGLDVRVNMLSAKRADALVEKLRLTVVDPVLYWFIPLKEK